MSGRPINVLILWADPNARNLGLQAIAEGVGVLAVRSWEGATMVYHSHDTVGTPLKRSWVLRDILRRNGPIKSLFRLYDVIVDTGGGDSFSDIYGMKRLVLSTYMHFAARRARVPMIMSPQTIGPFNTWLGRGLARYVLKWQGTKVCVRDPSSYEAVVSLSGQAPDWIASDLVFLLNSPEKGDSRRGLLLDRPPRVLVNVSGLLWFENRHVDYSYYRSELYSLIQGLKNRGFSIALIAHVLDSDSDDNDIPAMKCVLEQFPDLNCLVPRDLREVRDFIKDADLLIGSRMHACLNSLSLGVPTIPWAYSRKFEPLFSDLGWPYAFDLRSPGSTSESTLSLIDSVSLSEMEAEASRAYVTATGKFDGLIAAVRKWTVHA